MAEVTLKTPDKDQIHAAVEVVLDGIGALAVGYALWAALGGPQIAALQGLTYVVGGVSGTIVAWRLFRKNNKPAPAATVAI
jgi:uncharacterized membrane protein YuzA (DUF378 family)